MQALTVVQEYTYDVLGRRTSFFDVSAVDVGNSRTGLMSYNFDALNRITGEQRSVVGDPVANQWTLGYGYDAAGRVTNVGSTNYEYDTAGRPWKVLRGSSLIADYSYDTVGRLSQTRNYENSVERAKTIRGYDEINRISGLTTTGINNLGANSQLSAYTYTYNRANEPETFVSNQRLTNGTVTNASHTYTYDKLGRLITELDNGLSTTSQYTYDKLGNRKSVTANGVTNTSLSFDDAGRVTSSGWSYDAWGNVLSDGVGKNTYTYDGLNRMLTTTKAGSTYGYKYHGETMILRSVANSANGNVMTPQTALLHNTITGGYSSLLRIYSLPGAATYTTYAYGPYGGLLWSEYTNTNPVRRMAFFSDAQNTLRQQVNLTDGVTGNQDTDAWGVLTGATAPISSLRYTGEYTDFDTGLVFLRARWYNPANGTFQGRDPFAGFAEQPYSLHPYQYAYSNPTVYTDPSGRTPSSGSSSSSARANPTAQEKDIAKSIVDELCSKAVPGKAVAIVYINRQTIDTVDSAVVLARVLQEQMNQHGAGVISFTYTSTGESSTGTDNTVSVGVGLEPPVTGGPEVDVGVEHKNTSLIKTVQTKTDVASYTLAQTVWAPEFVQTMTGAGEAISLIGDKTNSLDVNKVNIYSLSYKFGFELEVDWGIDEVRLVRGLKVGYETCSPRHARCIDYSSDMLIPISAAPLMDTLGITMSASANNNQGTEITHTKVMAMLSKFSTIATNGGSGISYEEEFTFRNYEP